MNPTIHSFEGQDLDTRGLGTLIDCVSCDVTEELNGAFTLEMKYPLHGKFAEHLVPGNIIMARPNHVQVPQPFRIRQTKRTLGSMMTVYANHISYDLSGYPYTASASLNGLANVITALNNKMTELADVAVDVPFNSFNFETDMTSNNVFSMQGASSVKAWMGAMIETFGGEWEYDGYNCDLKTRRGEDTSARISYGKNLVEYAKEQNDAVYTHVCAYYSKSDITACGALYPTEEEGSFRVLYLNVTDQFPDQPPSSAQLNNAASEYIASNDFTADSITVTPSQIGMSVGLGDTVNVFYDTVYQTRVVKTVWNTLADQYTKLELGTIKPNIADTIKSISSSGDSIKVKAKEYSGTLNSYGCIQTDLKPETVVISAKTVTGTSFQCTPLVAGGWWWVRAVDWATGNKGSGSITVTVNYL